MALPEHLHLKINWSMGTSQRTSSPTPGALVTEIAFIDSSEIPALTGGTL
jgi:hypothetical protein